jgi:hypothetical protein
MDEAAVRIAPLLHLLERCAVSAENQGYVIPHVLRESLERLVDALRQRLDVFRIGSVFEHERGSPRGDFPLRLEGFPVHK